MACRNAAVWGLQFEIPWTPVVVDPCVQYVFCHTHFCVLFVPHKKVRTEHAPNVLGKTRFFVNFVLECTLFQRVVFLVVVCAPARPPPPLPAPPTGGAKRCQQTPRSAVHGRHDASSTNAAKRRQQTTPRAVRKAFCPPPKANPTVRRSFHIPMDPKGFARNSEAGSWVECFFSGQQSASVPNRGYPSVGPDGIRTWSEVAPFRALTTLVHNPGCSSLRLVGPKG